MMTESFDERLGWIEPDYYEKIDKDKSLIIKEDVEIGTDKITAEIHFKVSNTALKFTPEKKGISFLKFKPDSEDKKRGMKVPEAIIFVINGNETDIHIIECKTTVGFKTWCNIRNKFKGALIYSLPFIGILGLSIRGIKFYTAYLNDKMQPKPDENTAPSSLKVDLIRQWKYDKIMIASIKSAPHQKIRFIQLDDKIEEVRIII